MAQPNQSSSLFAFWAKLGADGSSHPLPCHMLDVAAVALDLWKTALHRGLRSHLSSALGLAEQDVGQWLAVFTALHDLGKASPAFQAKDPGATARLQAIGLPMPRVPGDIPHGSITATTLPPKLIELLGVEPKLARTVGTAVGGHHGALPVPPPRDYPRASVGGSSWDEARSDLVRAISDAIGLPAGRPRPIGPASGYLLAGFVSVADWIGSAEKFFPYALPPEGMAVDQFLRGYWESAQIKAREAVHTLGWDAWQPSTSPESFGRLFPAIASHPRPLQQAAADLLPSLDWPSLVVLEAPMGEGKTEAALLIADHLNATSGARGLYFALPTQATSNQMLGRVKAYLEHRFPDALVNLLLLHGHAALSKEFEMLRQNADTLLALSSVYQDEHEARQGQGAAIAGEWFTHRKRGLLAPFGVGTIDQALMAALLVRHGAVRLFGLAGKTVIVDEVHAYEAYTSSLLERLIEWLAALGSSVVLLSATLPRAKRDALIAKFQRGLGQGTPPVAARYPRITWVQGDGSSSSVAVAPSPEMSREVKLVRQAGQDDLSLASLAQRLRNALNGGGCAAVVCNTVGRAQDAYRALLPYFEGSASDGLPLLEVFHARFPFDERSEREQRVLARFGPPGRATGPRPDRAVLVATQVIEQSLDLDFDLMVSDFAPVDLLLQRSGRLWRHWRDLRRLQEPQLWVMGEHVVGDDIPAFPGGTEAVYDPHVLLCSWLALRDRSSIRLPEDIEDLVEAAYGPDEPPQGLSDQMLERWRDTRRELDRKLDLHIGQAGQRRLGPPNTRGELWEVTQRSYEEDASDLHPDFQALTRLTGPSVEVIVLYGTPAHPLVAPDGPDAPRLDRLPPLDEVEKLLRRSLSVSNRSLVHRLREQDVPLGWQRSPLLSRHRVLWLHDNGEWQSDPRVRLDPALGLLISAQSPADSGE